MSRNHSEQEFLDMVRDPSFVKFMVVRSPYDRLVSAFYDRVIGSQKRPSRSNWQTRRREIIRKFRVNATEEEIEAAVNPTFEEFLKWILYRYQIRMGTIDTPDTPVLLKSNGSFHWDPFWNLCDVCNVGYDYILRTETLSYDSQPVLTHLGYDSSFSLPHVHKVDADRRNKENFLGSKPLKEFEDIPTDLINRLKDWFVHEKMMFGYDLNVENRLSTCHIRSEHGVCC